MSLSNDIGDKIIDGLWTGQMFVNFSKSHCEFYAFKYSPPPREGVPVFHRTLKGVLDTKKELRTAGLESIFVRPKKVGHLFL